MISVIVSSLELIFNLFGHKFFRYMCTVLKLRLRMVCWDQIVLNILKTSNKIYKPQLHFNDFFSKSKLTIILEFSPNKNTIYSWYIFYITNSFEYHTNECKKTKSYIRIVWSRFLLICRRFVFAFLFSICIR